MYRVLLIDEDSNHATRLAHRLRECGLVVTMARSAAEAAGQLEQPLPVYDVAVVVAAAASEQSVSILRLFVQASIQLSLGRGPLFLFASRQKCSPQLRLRIEHLGARYVQA